MKTTLKQGESAPVAELPYRDHGVGHHEHGILIACQVPMAMLLLPPAVASLAPAMLLLPPLPQQSLELPAGSLVRGADASAELPQAFVRLGESLGELQQASVRLGKSLREFPQAEQEQEQGRGVEQGEDTRPEQHSPQSPGGLPRGAHFPHAVG